MPPEDSPSRSLERSSQVLAEIAQRWPENRIEPTLAREAALMDLLGEPQRAYPVIQVTGTNGKSSTARMIASLLRSLGLRTGLYTSPHLIDPRERIEIDGEPIDAERFIAVWEDVSPYVDVVDAQSIGEGGPPLTFFEILTGMAFAAFADAPVDVAVVEVGMGGTWDATSVAAAQVAVITPIDLDHMDYLGPDIASIAREKAGIIVPDALAVIGGQPEEAREIIAERAAEVGARVVWAGPDFEVFERDIAVGGQLLTLRGLAGVYDELFLPLFGAHQAANAMLALAAVEGFLGGTTEVDVDAVRSAFAEVTLPGRLEVVRRGPTVLVDAAHNPAGARALADALSEAFAFTHVVGVVSVLADKDVPGLLTALEPVLDELVVTQNSSPRVLPTDDLAAIAVEIFGEDRVTVSAQFADAIDDGIRLAEEADTYAASGVVVTGSVVTAGQARALLRRGT